MNSFLILVLLFGSYNFLERIGGQILDPKDPFDINRGIEKSRGKQLKLKHD